MNTKSEEVGDRACWFVIADNDWSLKEYLEQGVWIYSNMEDNYLKILKPIKPGDRIAIKSTYTRKHNLPFDNRDQWVPVMSIKAIGTVKEIPDISDYGYKLIVDWTPIDSPREWYLYINRGRIWRVLPGEWMADALISFTFDNKPQDINLFINEPKWRERFGDIKGETHSHSNNTDSDAKYDEINAEQDEEIMTTSLKPYSIDDILADGCFVDRAKLEKILERLRTKKNLILQGPPGTGKTWLAKRLAFAFMGQRNNSKLRALQFHPNLSYEDFVRGWRPAGDGRLSLVDGPFIEMIKAAAKEPTARYVVIIEEINRGNPAHIFGEMLTLLEADKRTPSEALELCYSRPDDERVFIPDNLYIIGTMNIADRSIALVDLALRRRFAFIDLEPIFGKPWSDWVHNQFGIDTEILLEIEKRIKSLNDDISADTSLGPQFQVGHSYVTPAYGIHISDPREWFNQVVETEILPLLKEYWFDTLHKAYDAKEKLLIGF